MKTWTMTFMIGKTWKVITINLQLHRCYTLYEIIRLGHFGLIKNILIKILATKVIRFIFKGIGKRHII
jgi:hypothetical protein